MTKNQAKHFWSYQSDSPTPTVDQLPPGAFEGTQADFEKLSPGMRREILRSASKGRVGVLDSFNAGTVH